MMNPFFSVFFIIVVFTSSVQSNNLFAAIANIFGRNNGHEMLWVPGFYTLLRYIYPSKTTAPVPIVPPSRASDPAFNQCVDDANYGGVLVAVVKVKEMVHCHDLCSTLPSTAWVFHTIADANGSHDCWCKKSEAKDKLPGPNFKAALFSCTGRAYRCFHSGLYIYRGYEKLKREVPVTTCYLFCLERGDNCKVFIYNSKTKECVISSMLTGERSRSPNHVSGFPRCDYNPTTTTTLITNTTLTSPGNPPTTDSLTMPTVEETTTLTDDLRVIRLSSMVCEGNLDYKGRELATFTVKDGHQCGDLCSVDPDCKVYVLVKLPDDGGYRCSLRMTIEFNEAEIQTLKHGKVQDACFERGFLCFESDVMYMGGFSISKVGTTLLDCYIECFDTPGCTAFYRREIGTSGSPECHLSTTWNGQGQNELAYLSGSMNCNRATITSATITTVTTTTTETDDLQIITQSTPTTISSTMTATTATSTTATTTTNLANDLQIIRLSSTICEGVPDYSGRELATFTVKDEDQCADLCALESDCKVYVLVRLADDGGYRCSLRMTIEFSGAEMRTLKHGKVQDACGDRSSMKCFEKDVEYVGGFRISGTGTTVHDCYTECYNTAGCIAFYREKLRNGRFRCYISSTWNEHKDNSSGDVSGALNCYRPLTSSTICEGDGSNLYPGREIAQLTVKEQVHCREFCADDHLCKVFIILEADGGYKCVLKSEDDSQTLIGIKTSSCSKREFLCFENSDFTRSAKTGEAFRDCYFQCRRAGCNAFYLHRNSHNLPICRRLFAWPRDRPAHPGYLLGTMDCSRPTFTESDYLQLPLPRFTICEGNPSYRLYYLGNELKGFTVKERDQCRDFCALNYDCKVFMIIEETPTGYRCAHYRSSVFGPNEFQTLKYRTLQKACGKRGSFLCFEFDVMYEGDFYLSTTVENFYMCYLKCETTPGCNAFYTKKAVRTNNRSDCYISSTWQGSKQDTSGYISGAMNCNRPTATSETITTVATTTTVTDDLQIIRISSESMMTGDSSSPATPE